MEHTRSAPTSEPTLVTPEAVALDLPLAGIGSRGVAVSIDLVILGIGLTLLSLAAGLADGVLTAIPGWIATTLMILLFTALLFGYPIGFETLWGRTPGKAILGLRVVTEEGGPVRFRHAATRAVLGIVDLQISFGAVALFSAFISSRSQRLGDIAAGTLVVRERSGAAAASASTFEAPDGLGHVVASLDTAGVSAEQYGAIRAYLRRAPSLPDDTSAAIASDLLARVRPSVRPPLPVGLPPAVALQVIAAAVQRRGRAATPATPDASRAPGPSGGFDAWAPRPERRRPVTREGDAAGSDPTGGFAPPP